MKRTPFSLPVDVTELLFTLLSINLVLSVAVAMLIGSKRVLGFWNSLFIGLIASAIIGLIVTLCYKTKKQKRIADILTNKFSDSGSVMHEIRQLEVLRQSGMISETEYESEIDRLLNL